MTINTANSLTNDDFINRNWQQQFAFIQSFTKEDSNYGSEPKKKYLESVNLPDISSVDDISISKSWDINLEKPFNSVIFKFIGKGSPSRVWITGISFEKSR